MARTCKLCGNQFPWRKTIDGVVHFLGSRKYCFDCSPFGSRNRRKLVGKVGSQEEIFDKQIKCREKQRKWQRKARKERKEKLIKMLGGKCSKCGYNRCIAALDFHHLHDKKFGLSAFGLCKSWEKLKEEVMKCILLCKNCHTELHYLKN